MNPDISHLMQRVKLFLYYLSGALVVILLFVESAHLWQDFGYGHVSPHLFSTELWFWILLLVLFDIPVRQLWLRVLAGVVPVLGLYLSFDLFYSFLARSPLLSDVKNFQLIADFSPLFMAGILFAIVVMLAIPVYAGYIYYKMYGLKKLLFFVVNKLVLLSMVVLLLTSTPFKVWLEKRFDYYNWSQSKTIKTNGRISTFYFLGLKQDKAAAKLQRFRKLPIRVDLQLFGRKPIIQKRNLYIVLLESFIDPRLIDGVQFDRSPLADEMKKYLIDGNFSYVISPVYGGGTSQAEFEILTGIRAMAKVDSIEFNTLQGCAISGFTHYLKHNGYQTYAVIASGPQYYNAKTAYRCIGFDQTVFLEEDDRFKVGRGNGKVFDGWVYRYILQGLRKQSYRPPYLIYALGMYGHFPYSRDMQKQPDEISVTHHDERVKRIANQFYYRTRALASYIGEILKQDPHAIILISSDHIPPLLDNGVKYMKPQNTNIALLLVDGNPVDIDGLHYFEIPRLIVRILQGERKPLQKGLIYSPNVEEKLYYKVLAESLK